METYIAVLEGVIDGMEAWPPSVGSESAGFLRGLKFALDLAEKEAEPEPAKETRPVVHAHWDHDLPGGVPRCSACGRRPHNADYGAGENGFCGFCGAQMDEPPE